MTREEIEALATQHGMLGQMVTTNLLVSFAELVVAQRERDHSDELFIAYQRGYDKGRAVKDTK